MSQFPNCGLTPQWPGAGLDEAMFRTPSGFPTGVIGTQVHGPPVVAFQCVYYQESGMERGTEIQILAV